MKKIFKHKYLKVILSIVLFFALIEILFLFFAKPILKRSINRFLYRISDSTYLVSYNDLRINLINGKILLTNFELSPDTSYIFSSKKKYNTDFYKIKLDTFFIQRINLSALTKKRKELLVKTVLLSNPDLSVYSVRSQSKRKINLEKNSVSLDTLKNNLAKTLFKKFGKIRIKKFEIIDGNFDFLKPKADNPNPFSIQSITFIIKNLLIDKHTFGEHKKNFISDDIEMIIKGYRLRLNDNIHILSSKRVYLSTINKVIELDSISIEPDNRIEALPEIDSTIMDVGIDKMSFKNVDFNRFYLKNELCLSSANVRGMTIRIYRNKNHRTKKKFNKDTLLDKIDLYAMIKNYLRLIEVDTMKIEKCRFFSYNGYKNNTLQTSISDLELNIYDFRVDSTSLRDTARVLYTRNLDMQIKGFKQMMKDSVHTLSAGFVKVSSKNKNILAKDIKILANPRRKLWAIEHRKNYNFMNISLIKISGFDIYKYAHTNAIAISTLLMSHSSLKLLSFGKKKNKKKKLSFRYFLQAFADKINIRKIIIDQGFLKYMIKERDNNLMASGRYKVKITGFRFDPYEKTLKKSLSVRSFNAYFTHMKFNSPDSIYKILADSIYYSTNSSLIKFVGLRLSPIQKNLISHLTLHNRSFVLDVRIPSFAISKTNLYAAFQMDSLYLRQIKMVNPEFSVTIYPQIEHKTEKKNLVNKIKRKTIARIIMQSTKTDVFLYEGFKKLDSANFISYNVKKRAIDTIATRAVSAIVGLRIKSKDILPTDTSIGIIDKIKLLAIKKMNKIASIKTPIDSVYRLENESVNEINHLKNTYLKPKFDEKKFFGAIGKLISKITFDSLDFENAKFRINRFVDGNKEEFFSSTINLNLSNFNFDTSCIDSTNRILFSKAFSINVKDAQIILKKGLYKLLISKIDLNSLDSDINISGIKYFSTNKSNVKKQFFGTKRVRITGVVFRQLYYNHSFVADSFQMIKPFVSISSLQKKKKKKFGISTIFLPPNVSHIKLRCIDIRRGRVEYTKGDELSFSCNLGMKIKGLKIDSVFNINKNLYFLPIKDFSINATNIKYTNTKNEQNVLIDSVLVVSDSGFVGLRGLFYSSMGDKKISLRKRVEQKNRLELNLPEMNLSGLSFSKLRFKKDFLFQKINIENPNIEIYRQAAKKKKNIKIDEINLYKTTKKIFHTIGGQYFSIRHLSTAIDNFTDSTEKKQTIPVLDFSLRNLKIDSNTTVKSPHLFYAQDVSIGIHNIDYVIQDSLYRLSARMIKFSTEGQSLDIEGLTYRPRKSFRDVQQHHKWRTTPLSVDIRHIAVKGIDYNKLIFDKSLKIHLVKIDTMNFEAYNDKNYPHNYKKKKEHLIGPIFDAKFPIDIHLIKMNNVFVKYREINPKNEQVAHISLDSADVLILNITNDTSKIRKKDLYTIIEARGYINDTAQIDFNVYYQLLSRGNIAKVTGKIGECPAKTFNSYTYNGANLLLDAGEFHTIEFNFNIDDSLSEGKMRMEYNDLRATLVSKDTLKRKKLKFVSWLLNVLLVKKDNPRYGIYPKIGQIAYIHDKSFGDVRLWVKSLLSGVQSTISFKPKDAKKIRKIMRKNKRKLKKMK